VQDESTLREVAKDCVHCGFCLPACPTYQLWAEEMDSPRGRIYLVSQILDGASLSAAAAGHFDRCLGCMACMTACPSGVQYDQLIEAARVWTEEARSVAGSPSAAGVAPTTGEAPSAGAAGTRRDRAARAAIFALFPYPRRLRALTAPLRLAQRTGLDRRVARSRLPARVSPVLGAALRLAPPGVSAAEARPLPRRVPALGTRRAVVGMLTGCVQSVFFPQVNAATARVLAAEGCDVVIPRGQGCCGALSLHSGREEEAADFARRTIAAFEQAGVDAVVVNSAGCGSAMKEYERLLRGAGGGWAERAAEMSGKVQDLAEFLAGIGPRELLRAIPELNLVEVPDAGTCCGSAGVYNLLQPEAATELGARKAESVAATGAPLLISANPGCSLQIASALAARGQDIAVAHTAEVLDASIRGRPLRTPPG
jgi:glycolate oxidase iron-sulfur subunit